MVSSFFCFFKYLSDEPIVSKGIPGPEFLTWYWLWRGTFWIKLPETAGKLQTQHFLGKPLGEQGRQAKFWGSAEIPTIPHNRGNSGGPHPNELGLQKKPIAMVGNSGLILDLCWVPKSSSLSFQRNIFTRNDCKKHWFRRFKQSFKNSPMSA